MYPSVVARTAPANRNRLVVLHDADCGLCLAAASLLRRWDRRGHLDLVPLQLAASDPRPVVRRAAASFPLARALHAFDEAGGSVVSGGAAVGAIVARLPGGRLPAAVLAAPAFRWTVAAGYALVAANRHRIGQLLGLEGPGCLVDPAVPADRRRLIITAHLRGRGAHTLA